MNRRQIWLSAGSVLVASGLVGSVLATNPSLAADFPSYNSNPLPANAEGMNSTAPQIAERIKLGFNIGNTLEAIGGETAWGNPIIAKGLIEKVKSLGFSAIRLPCAWNQYANDATAKISDTWLNRVKTVVQYCVDADFYVLLNIHWDGGWLENNVTIAAKARVIARQKAFWEQIATHFRDFDERLIFASANEPNVENAEQMSVLFDYHQTFIDAVRSTGGRNAYRALVLQGPKTDIEATEKLWKGLPKDTVENRLMTEVHFYTPYPFTLMTEDQNWGKMVYYWGKDNHSARETDRNATWGEEALVDQHMQMMKRVFVDKGIPVILGEYAAILRKNPKDMALHQNSRNHWLKYVTRSALANGLLPFVWDTGSLIDRARYKVLDEGALKALLEGAGL